MHDENHAYYIQNCIFFCVIVLHCIKKMICNINDFFFLLLMHGNWFLSRQTWKFSSILHHAFYLTSVMCKKNWDCFYWYKKCLMFIRWKKKKQNWPQMVMAII